MSRGGTVIVEPAVDDWKMKPTIAGGETMIPRVATPYDQNPARIALVLKARRKQARKKHPRTVSLLISLGIVALYAAVYFPG